MARSGQRSCDTAWARSQLSGHRLARSGGHALVHVRGLGHPQAHCAPRRYAGLVCAMAGWHGGGRGAGVLRAQKALGRLLLQSHSLCRALTWLTIALECAAPVGLLLCDGARASPCSSPCSASGVLHLLSNSATSPSCARRCCASACPPRRGTRASSSCALGRPATATAPPKAVGIEALRPALRPRSPTPRRGASSQRSLSRPVSLGSLLSARS